MQNDIQLQLEQIKELWENITTVPEDLTPHGFPGLTKQSITNSLGGLSEIAEYLATVDDYEPSPISKSILLPHLTNIRTYVTTHIPPTPIPHIPGLLSIIDSIQTTLRRWLEEANKNGEQQGVTTALAERLANATSQIKDANVLYENIKKHHESLAQLVSQANLDSSSASQANVAIGVLLGTSTTTATQVETISTGIKNNAITIENLTSSFLDLKVELEANKNTQELLFKKFEGYSNEIHGLLQDASRTGMAASFTNRRIWLLAPMAFWILIFAGSIGGLIFMGSTYIAPILSSENFNQLPSRLALTAPFIWLGWFAAKQYGYSSRLREDYAYKEASAKSFEGYKREASQVSPEMLKNLLETAIKNLGDNPIRIYSGHENHASPLHEILEKSLKDEKVMDLLKAIFAKARG